MAPIDISLTFDDIKYEIKSLYGHGSSMADIVKLSDNDYWILVSDGHLWIESLEYALNDVSIWSDYIDIEKKLLCKNIIFKAHLDHFNNILRILW